MWADMTRLSVTTAHLYRRSTMEDLWGMFDFYSFQTPHRYKNYEVQGLWYESRGTALTKSKHFLDEIGIDLIFSRLLEEIIILDS